MQKADLPGYRICTTHCHMVELPGGSLGGQLALRKSFKGTVKGSILEASPAGL